MKPDLPAGSVTFVFTDIEGSTRLLGELGSEGYAAALARHREVIRRECADRGGVEVDTQGDAFFIAFPVALDAVAAMAAVDRRLEDGPIRVRAGIHAGHALLTGDGYVGEDVHLASRIAGAAHGGQVVMSDATSAALRREAVAAPPRLIDLGMHRLKDFPDPVRLHQLGDRRFPPLRTLFRTDLPVASTPFVGREGELAAVVDLLGDEATRLLTLTGSGGTGKTRLALRAAEEVSGRFDGGTTWVRLATVSDRALVAPLVAQALDVREEPGVDIVVTLAAALAGRRCVIVLDNLEQLLPDVTLDVESLLRAPGLVVLATSRERLGLAVERVYPVPPMGGDDAVALFTARARALDPSFEPTAIVEELCARLDDLPLAIELAAGRSQLFAPEELLRRLLGHLDLLAATRGSDPRQATLRATFEWSYELLAAEERRLLRALSVFQGGCDYEAAEAVAGATPDRLQSLIDKGLMRRRGSPTGPRYAMLGTIQQFASELLAPEEGASLRGTHLRWLADRLGRRDGRRRISGAAPPRRLVLLDAVGFRIGWRSLGRARGRPRRALVGAIAPARPGRCRRRRVPPLPGRPATCPGREAARPRHARCAARRPRGPRRARRRPRRPERRPLPAQGV
jgi:predicted ATPase/class 3 adenylate cyclase